MPRTYYKLLYRLEGVDALLIWYSNDADGVATSDDHCVPSFETVADLLAYADARGLVVAEEEPVLHDLDAVAAWLANPQEETVACSDFLAAWNLFGDVARSCPQYSASFADRGKQRDAVYDKLFWGSNLPSVTPPGEQYTPEWSRDEVTSLRQLLQAGLEMFVAVRRQQT
jgi:hypothetical protein